MMTVNAINRVNRMKNIQTVKDC